MVEVKSFTVKYFCVMGVYAKYHNIFGGLDRETGEECLWPVYDSYLAW